MSEPVFAAIYAVLWAVLFGFLFRLGRQSGELQRTIRRRKPEIGYIRVARRVRP
jgi:CcmD family protein